jgi:hypothetical protein
MSERDPSVPPWWQIGLFIEAAVLIVALLMPITPSKTGSDSGMAGYFFEAPTYVHEVLVGFVLTNALLLVIGVAVFVWVRRDRSDA